MSSTLAFYNVLIVPKIIDMCQQKTSELLSLKSSAIIHIAPVIISAEFLMFCVLKYPPCHLMWWALIWGDWTSRERKACIPFSSFLEAASICPVPGGHTSARMEWNGGTDQWQYPGRSDIRRAHTPPALPIGAGVTGPSPPRRRCNQIRAWFIFVKLPAAAKSGDGSGLWKIIHWSASCRQGKMFAVGRNFAVKESNGHENDMLCLFILFFFRVPLYTREGRIVR